MKTIIKSKVQLINFVFPISLALNRIGMFFFQGTFMTCRRFSFRYLFFQSFSCNDSLTSFSSIIGIYLFIYLFIYFAFQKDKSRRNTRQIFIFWFKYLKKKKKVIKTLFYECLKILDATKIDILNGYVMFRSSQPKDNT